MRRHLMPFAFPNVYIHPHLRKQTPRELGEKSLPTTRRPKKKKPRKYKYIVEWDVYTVERVVSRSSVNFFFSLFFYFFLFFLAVLVGGKRRRKKVAHGELCWPP
jgi:hypothetical protein